MWLERVLWGVTKRFWGLWDTKESISLPSVMRSLFKDHTSVFIYNVLYESGCLPEFLYYVNSQSPVDNKKAVLESLPEHLDLSW